MLIKPKHDERAERCKEYYEVLIVPLRYIAYRCGYALAVHGSLTRDIDLIAAPWRESAIDAASLIEHFRVAIEAIVGTAEIDPRLPEKKPCGRLAWSIHVLPAGVMSERPYLDISVLPIVKSEPAPMAAVLAPGP